MAVIDPRLEMARRARAAAVSTPNVVTLKQTLQRGIAAPTSGQSPDAVRLLSKALSMQDVQNRMKAVDIAQGRTANADEGLLAKIVDNPIAKTILKPLEVLDVPRRLIISGIHEVSDAIGSGDASWSDFINQAKDPTYGVGRYVDTGNKWTDRILGFIGDVALDPMTYVTFGGSKFAGASGRLALAEKVALKTGDDVLASSVARFGRAALTAQQIADLDIKGLKQAGIYFMGKKVGRDGLIGRGSEVLGSMGERSLNRLRFVASDSKLVKFAQNAFTTDVNREARLMLLRGEAPQGMAADLLHVVNSRNVQRSAQGIAFSEAQVAIAKMAKETGAADNAALGNRIRQVLEGAGAPATEVEQAAAAKWRAWFDASLDQVNAAMQKADPTAAFGKINNYVPLMYTELAREELRNPTSRFASFIKKGMDDGDPLSVFEPRYLFKKIREDGSVDWFGTKLTADMLPSPQTLADGTALTIDTLNKIARDAGFAGDVFETDILTIANKYSYQHSAQMGLAAKYEELVSKGTIFRREAVYEQSDELFDPEATKAAADWIAKHVAETEAAHGALVDAIKNVRGALRDGGKMVEERLSRAVGLTAEQTVAAQRHEVISMIQSLTDPIMQHLEKLGASSAKVFDSTVEWAITSDMLDAELKRVADDAQRLSAEMMDAAVTRYGTLSNAVEAQQLFNEYSGQLAQLEARAAKAQQQFATAVEMAPIIQARWDDIVAGRQFAASSTLTKEQASRLNALSKAAGYRGTPTSTYAIEGAFRDWVKASDGMQTLDWWKRVNGVVDVALSTSEVADIAAKDVPQMLRNITGSSLESVHQMRVAGSWLLAHDSAVFGEVMPNAELAAARQELVDALSEAADSQLRAAQIGKIVTSNRNDAKALKVGSEAVGQVQAIERSFKEYIKQSAVAAGWRDGIWNEDAARKILVKTLDQWEPNLELLDSLTEQVYRAGLGRDGQTSDQILAIVDNAKLKKKQLLKKEHAIYHPDGWKQSGTLQDYVDSYGRLTVNSKELADSGYGEVAAQSTAARQAVATPREAADRAAMAIERYKLQSDFTHRLIQATESMIQFGVVPTESMTRQLFNAAAQDGLERWTLHSRNVNAAAEAVTQIRARFASIITTPGWDGSRGVALQQAWREISDMLPPDVASYLDRTVLQFGDPSVMLDKMREKYWLGDVLGIEGKFDTPIRGVRPKETAQEFYEAVGKDRGLPTPNAGESATAYRKRGLEKIKYNPKKTRRDFVEEYYQSTVKPWYQQNYPGRAGKEKAVQALKERAIAAQAKSPFRPDVANWEIEEFFSLLVGGEVRGGRTGMAVTRNRYMQQSERTRAIGSLQTVRGAMQEDRRLASQVSAALRLAADRNVDIDKFMADFAVGARAAVRGQRTPTMFADTMRWLADSIEGLDVKIAGAYDETIKAAERVKRTQAELSRAQAFEDAVSTAPPWSPSETVDGLPKGIDPKKAAEFRGARFRLRRLQATEDYALALKEQQRVDLLRRLSGVDGWKARVETYVDGPAVEGWAVSRGGGAGASIVKDGNGNALTFSQAEWEALFIDDRTAASEAARLRGDVGRAADHHKVIEARIELLRTELTDNAGSLSANKARTMRREIRQLERRSKVVADYLEHSRMMLSSMSPSVRKTAHEKFDALAALGDSVFGELPMRQSFMGGPGYHAGSFSLGDSVLPNAEERLARLEGSWAGSRSGTLIAEVASLNEQVSNLGFDSMLSKAEQRAAAAEELRRAAQVSYQNKLFKIEAEGTVVAEKAPALAAYQATHGPDGFTTKLDSARRALETAPTVTAPGADPAELARQMDAATRQLEAGIKVGEMRQAAGGPNYPSRMDTTPTRLRKAAVAADQIGVTPGQLADVSPNVAADAVSSTADAFTAAFQTRGADAVAREAQAAAADAERALLEVTARAKAAGNEQQVLDSLLNGDGLGKLRVKTGTSGRTKTIKQVYGVSSMRDAQVMFDSVQTFSASADLVRSEIIPSIERQAEAIKTFVGSVPKQIKPDDVKEARALYAASKEFAAAMSDAAGIDINRVEALAKLAADSADPMLQSLVGVLRKGTVSADDPVMKAVASVLETSNAFLMSVDKQRLAQALLDSPETTFARVAKDVSYKTTKGFEDLASLGLPGMQASPEIKKMLSNMQQLEDPQFARLVGGFLGNYTKFFKGYATLSPGFHVRNALSNTFMLLASGSDVRNLKKGLRLYRSLMDHMESGASFASWAESAVLKELSAQERESAMLAARTMFGAGGGNTSEQLRGMLRDGQSWIMDNWALRKSSSVGQKVEGSARFMLAFDSAQQGLDLNASMARVKRFLFDYQDVSVADKNMRSVVPFWLWMSRNLPLQIMNQWSNPRMYAIYNSFARNIGQPATESDMTPSWMTEQGAIKVGQDAFLTPDLGFNRVQQQLAEMGDIPRMASYLNPGLRVPVELLGNRQLYNDVPFSSTQQAPAAGPLTPAVQALASTLGLTDTNAQGQQVWDPRWNYALRNLLPPVGQLERLMPSNEYGQQKAGNSLRGYFGIPFTEVTDGMKQGEIARRQREIQQLASAARSLGFNP